MARANRSVARRPAEKKTQREAPAAQAFREPLELWRRAVRAAWELSAIRADLAPLLPQLARLGGSLEDLSREVRRAGDASPLAAVEAELRGARREIARAAAALGREAGRLEKLLRACWRRRGELRE